MVTPVETPPTDCDGTDGCDPTEITPPAEAPSMGGGRKYLQLSLSFWGRKHESKPSATVSADVWTIRSSSRSWRRARHESKADTVIILSGFTKTTPVNSVQTTVVPRGLLFPRELSARVSSRRSACRSCCTQRTHESSRDQSRPKPPLAR